MRKTFLDLHTRRLNQWDGRKKVEPPTVDDLPATPTTPQAPATPTPVNDYTPNSGIVEPVPVSTVSSEGIRIGGGGGERELQVDYGSMRVMTGQSSSAFIPAATHQPQQQVQRTLSLPAQQQQQGTVYVLDVQWVCIELLL